MNRTIVYIVGNKYSEFVERLKDSGFKVNDQEVVFSSKEKVHDFFSLGFFEVGRLYVYSKKDTMNRTEISERSKLLKIADNFNPEPNLSLIDRHMTP